MKNNNIKIYIYFTISFVCGMISSINEFKSFEGLLSLITQALGNVLGAFLIASFITLILGIFDKTLFKRFLSLSSPLMMAISILVTLVRLFGS